MRLAVADYALLAGAVLLIVGFGLLSWPLGIVAAGALLLGGGVYGSLAGERKNEQSTVETNGRPRWPGRGQDQPLFTKGTDDE